MFPVALIPFDPTEMPTLFGFIEMGVRMSVKVTVLGTVLIIFSKSVPQVEKKLSWDAANCLIVLPPSALKMRWSERVVSLWPNTKAFWDPLLTKSVALEWHQC